MQFVIGPSHQSPCDVGFYPYLFVYVCLKKLYKCQLHFLVWLIDFYVCLCENGEIFIPAQDVRDSDVQTRKLGYDSKLVAEN